ncbi:COX15/CtaA family protein [Cellvibrio japonicus]|uniref:Uncharacterized protein required for cytochrome oxidase assembly n=1 Tax=Cellvibrio japonicus (strain Ueda107) TaxID=498211 RepID=B3PKW5_CELJU|nr:COX15/CtaA family protein [Cellvibrio japonicus]ACE86057.1 uncharacterized protein required for cytochrome oxidase assembly [Cellvibrio japonicus Ueda107]QEI11522.1 heme A synthase [Cellvibrio japonicus]QEI15096.1 heme A synthase [Cellvibrio japonicus]QEI18676.1 heme A synthase [Cellvibrio japonicus]
MEKRLKRFRLLVNATLVLTLMVIALGAYTRLTDAGLGCPDWPGCYGLLHAPSKDHHIERAQANFPEATIEPHKARNEMLHRYIAGLLGLCVAAIFFYSLMIKHFRRLSGALLLLVIFQAALGMWTVTLNLLPLVVLGHLLGGFFLLCLLMLLRLEIGKVLLGDKPIGVEPALRSLMPLGYLAVVVLVMQIALGGWTSANYAAVVCYQLPFCEPGWQERFSLDAAFHLPLGHETYEYGVLPYEARMTIHVLHRMGAITTALVLGCFIWLVWRRAQERMVKHLSLAVLGLLLIQILLGLINILGHLPLLNAVAHNLVAANLLMFLVVLVRQLQWRTSLSVAHQPVAAVMSRGESYGN